MGRGSSIAIDDIYKYSSLYDKAFNNNENVNKIFKEYDTKDFELILDRLYQAGKINTILEINDSDNEIKNNYNLIKNSLIKVIRENHINYSDVYNYLDNIIIFLKNFNKVFSLNYDLIIYWSILKGNDEEKYGNYFKDCFVSSYFDDDWIRFQEPYGADGSTLIFYPHGNLILARDENDSEIKINKESSYKLLEQIFTKWDKSNYRPLFVSEGNSEQKLQAIKRSSYLNIVYYNILNNIESNLCIYGWSLADNDNHLIEKIFKDNFISNVAISIYKGDRDSRDLKNEMRNIKTKIKNYTRNTGINIYFYNSQSDDCWIY